MFKPVKKMRVYEEIVDKMTDMIKNGVLKEGDQLPGERELAETFSAPWRARGFSKAVRVTGPTWPASRPNCWYSPSLR